MAGSFTIATTSLSCTNGVRSVRSRIRCVRRSIKQSCIASESRSISAAIRSRASLVVQFSPWCPLVCYVWPAAYHEGTTSGWRQLIGASASASVLASSLTGQEICLELFGPYAAMQQSQWTGTAQRYRPTSSPALGAVPGKVRLLSSGFGTPCRSRKPSSSAFLTAGTSCSIVIMALSHTANG